MAGRHREVIWTLQGHVTLDEAISYIAEDSLPSAQKMLQRALDAAASLSNMSERGRIVPELEIPAIREIFVLPYRLIYEIHDTSVEILAFIHGSRNFAKWQQSIRKGGTN